MVSQRGQLRLNGQSYVLTSMGRDGTLWDREKVPPFAPVQSPTTFQSPETFQNYRVISIADFLGGLGRRRIPSEDHADPAAYARFWDGDLDTRWTTGSYLPLRAVTTTSLPSDTSFLLHTGNDLEALRVGVGALNYFVIAYDFQAATSDWNTTGITPISYTFSAPSATIFGDAIVVENTAYTAIWVNNNQSFYRLIVGRDLLPLGSATEDHVIPGGIDDIRNTSIGSQVRLASVGGDIILAYSTASAIKFSVYDGTSWSDTGTGSINESSSRGPTGLAGMPGPDGIERMYVGMLDGLYETDMSGDTWVHTLIDPMFVNSYNCFRMLVHQGALYYGVGVDDNAQFTLRRLSNRSGAQVVEDVSVPDDGLPGDTLGSITFMVSQGDQLFVAVGGLTTGQHARVFVLLSDDTWHVIYRHPTEDEEIKGMALSDQDDGVPRLHLLIEPDGTDESVYLEHPYTHPESGVSIDREDEGFIVLPEMDAGLPSFDKAWYYTSLVAGGDFGDADSGNVIDVDYESAEDTWTELGSATTDDVRLEWPDGGLERDRLRLRLRPERGDTVTDSPVLRNLVIAVNPEITTYRYRFRVNIERTAQVLNGRGSTILTQLRAAAASTSLVPMKYADDIETMVDITEYREMTRLSQPEALQATWGDQVGYVEIIATERYEQR